MNNLKTTLVFAVVVALGSLACHVRTLHADEGWQTSWEAFVEAYNKCSRQDTCDKTQFVDKIVTWTATIKSLDKKEGQLNVLMDMTTSPPLVDKTGAKSSMIILTLHPTPAEQAAWGHASNGQKVRFRCKTTRPFPDMDSPVGLMSFGPGKNTALVSTEGGELIEILANP